MTRFNRIFAGLIGLGVATGAALVLAVLARLASPEQARLGAWVGDGLRRLSAMGPQDRLVAIMITALVLVLGIWLVWLELATVLQSPKPVVLRDAASGSVTVAVEGLRQIAEHEAMQVDGVVDSRATVSSGRAGLTVRCTIAVIREATVPIVAEQVRVGIQAALQHHLGRPAERVTVHARSGSLSHRQRVSRVS